MEIHIAGDNIDLTTALQDYVHKRIEKIHTLFSNITHVQVTLSMDKKFLHNAKATVHMANTEVLHASSEDKDMYAAIDFLAEKIKKQVIKHKEKMSNHGNGDII
jgi:putative sigma-54 modulation protein